MFSLVLQHMVVLTSKHISISLLSVGGGGKRKRTNISSGEGKAGEAQ